MRISTIWRGLRGLSVSSAIILIGVGGTVMAQQQTGQVAPETRNPQTNVTELFPQQKNIQPTEDEQILTRPHTTIQIPSGEPADRPGINVEAQKKRERWMYVSVISILAAIALFKISSRVQSDKTDQKSASGLEKVLSEPVPVTVLSQIDNKRNIPKPKSKKKTGKGKPRPKK